MSTRSQLFVKGSDVVLYRHSDGYPEGKYGVLACILPFLADFHKYRGVDPYYCSAQLLGRLIAEANHDADLRERRRKRDDPNFNAEDYKEFRFLGFGVEAYTTPESVLHGDIEYLYVIDLEKQTVEVRTPNQAFYGRLDGLRRNRNGPPTEIAANTDLLITFKFSDNFPRGEINSTRRKKNEQTPASATT